MVFKERFTSAMMIRFLKRLVKHSRRKVYLIVDRHPVHRSRKVQQWLDFHRKAMRMFLLPEYSPELNPDELLKRDVKTNAVGRQRPENPGRHRLVDREQPGVHRYARARL